MIKYTLTKKTDTQFFLLKCKSQKGLETKYLNKIFLIKHIRNRFNIT